MAPSVTHACVRHGGPDADDRDSNRTPAQNPRVCSNPSNIMTENGVGRFMEPCPLDQFSNYMISGHGCSAAIGMHQVGILYFCSRFSLSPAFPVTIA
jgi:hypothetical protein